MRRGGRGRSWLGWVLLGLALLPGEASAQSIWTEQSRSRGAWLEVVKSEFVASADVGFQAWALFATVSWPLTGRLRLLVDVAYANLQPESIDGLAGTSFGNPLLGLEVKPGERPLYFRLSARVPVVAVDDAAAANLGFVSEFVERAEAFAIDVVPVQGTAIYRPVLGSGFTLDLRAGPTLWIATDEAVESEVFAIYSAQVWYATLRNRLRFGAGASGRAWLSKDEDADATAHELGVAGSIDLGRLRPGLHFRVPLTGDLRDLVDYTVGLNLCFEL